MMRKADRWINSGLMLMLLLYSTMWITGLVTGSAAYLVAWINMVAGFFVILYWIHKQLSIRQHYIEAREIIVLCLELVIIAVAALSLFSDYWNSWARVFHYAVFALHFIFLLCLMVFMLTFKMKRLI